MRTIVPYNRVSMRGSILKGQTTLGSITTSYTATEDCYVVLTLGLQANSSGSVSFSIDGTTILSLPGRPYAENLIGYTIPLSKGQTLSMYQNSNIEGYYTVLRR